MKNKKWDQFEKLTRKCYTGMAGMEESGDSWDKAFDMLKQVLAEERNREPGYGAELYQLDEITDYEYDVQGWLEDYLDEVDMGDDGERLLAVCDELMGMFRWEEEAPSDIKFLKASALKKLGRQEEAAEYCREWLAEEPDSVAAVAASIYALLSIQDMEACEKLIKQHIHEDTKCTEENDVIFTAAAEFYKMSGNEKEWKRLEDELEEYDKELEQYLKGWGEEDEGEILFF